ncbi:MAG: hypothetical protein GX352_10205 [Clostridiales bacterium]|nr:hypothetical protein [Clostridiales bacterium]
MQDNTVKSFLDPVLITLMEKEVSKSKDAEEPVNRAFEVIAQKSGLKFNTVRNYYYRYIHSKNNGIPGKGRGNRDMGDTVAGSTFTEQEVKELVEAMLIEQAKGGSVRGCANRLAEGDKRLMLRYQNKYRNVLSGNPEYVEGLMKDMSDRGMVYFDPLRKQIIHGKTHMAEGDLIENIGQLASNIDEIDSPALDNFFRGLHELTQMAVQYKRSDKGGDQTLILAMVNRLIGINKKFLDLPPTGKLTGLSEYIRQVESCIKDMGTEQLS